MKKFSFISCLLGLILVGCDKAVEAPVSFEAPASQPHAQLASLNHQSASNAKFAGAIQGKWVGEIASAANKKDDPATQMAASMAKMMGKLTLTISGDEFSLKMMGIPLEGHVEAKNGQLSLVPETVMGMSKEELSSVKSSAKSADMKPMTIALKPDGSIELSGGDPNDNMVFRRDTSKAKVCASNVTESESNFVGTYSGTMSGMPTQSGAQAKMMEKLAKSLKLELRSDHSFDLTVGFELGGTWTLSGNKMSLDITKMMGMEDMKSKSDPLVGIVSADGSQIVITDPKKPGKLTFTKK